MDSQRSSNDALAGATTPIDSCTQHTLAERRDRIAKRRLIGEPAVGLLRTAVPAVASLLADEFRAGSCILRFGLEDILCDEESGSFALVADLPRHPIDALPSGLSLLDNGIYAPELTRQIQRDLSPRTDVYALGAVLYSLITGLEPTPELSRMVVTGAGGGLPPLRIFEEHLPLGLDPILARALARLPEERFPDCEAMADAIEAVFALDAERRREVIGPRLETRYAAATHGGIHKSTKNPRNQDRHFCDQTDGGELGLFVVADGVTNCDLGTGDRAAEYVAAAAETAWSVLEEHRDDGADLPRSPLDDLELGPLLDHVFNGANEAIAIEATELALAQFPDGEVPGDLHVMSSTAVALLKRGREATIANLGDSRVYLIRDEWIDQITVDRDRRTERLRLGQGLDAIVNASGLGELTTAVGCATWRRTEVGACFSPVPIVSDLTTLNLLPGDRLLVCSDGVPDCIGRDAAARIHEIVTTADCPARATWNLVAAANEGGGDDNITAILIECTEEEDLTCPKN